MLNKSAITAILGSTAIGIAKSVAGKGSFSRETFAPRSMEELISVSQDRGLSLSVTRLHLDGYVMLEAAGVPEKEWDSFVLDIPDEITRFRNITHLTATGLNISKLPDYFDLLDKLKRIDLSENKFTRIPQQIFLNPSLESIDLSFNQMSELNGSDLQFLNQNTKINLSNCDIERLSDDYVSTVGSRIENIDLSANKFLMDAPDEYLVKLIDSGFPIPLFLKYFRPASRTKKDYRYYYGEPKGIKVITEGMYSNIFKLLEYCNDPVWLITRIEMSIQIHFSKRKSRPPIEFMQDLFDKLFSKICLMKNLKSLNINVYKATFSKVTNSEINANIPESISNLQNISYIGLHGFNHINGIINLNNLDLRIRFSIDCNHLNFQELYSVETINELSILMEDLVLPEGIDRMKGLYRLKVPYIVEVPDSILNLLRVNIIFETNRNSSDWKPKKYYRIPHPRKILEAVQNGFSEGFAKSMIGSSKTKSQLRRF